MRGDYAIELSNLSKEFKQGNLRIQALPQISFNMELNDRWLVSGENGCGKTTLLKIISTLIQPTSGNCDVFGYSLKEGNAIRKNLAFIPDKLDFDFSMSGFEFWKQISICRGTQPDINIFNDLINDLGLSSWLDRKIGAYSFGMRKRLMIAIWLSLKPKLLLLDEFDTGLDREGKLIIEGIFAELEDISILGISHSDNLKLGRDMKKRSFKEFTVEEE